MQIIHCLVAALPIAFAAKTAYTSKNWVETFDMQDSSFVPPGLDQALQWNLQISLPIRDDHEDCYGVCYDTFPADVAFNQTTTKTPSNVNVTSVYKSSQVHSFTLSSFAFGCDSPGSTTIDGTAYSYPVPLSCTIKVHGKPVDGGPVRTFTSDYTPQNRKPRNANPYAAAMKMVSPPASFGNVTTVWFTYTTTGTSEAPYPGTLYLDTFQYTTYNATKKA